MRQAYLNQVGGHVLTLDEARRTGREGEFIKQRELLKSGAFGGMVKTDAQATDLMEALAKPQSEANTKRIGDLLQSERDRGVRVAEQNRTIMSQMAVNVESIKMFGGLEMLAAIKAGWGVNNNDPKFRNILREDRERELQYAAQAQKGTETGTDLTADQANKAKNDYTKRVGDIVGGAGAIGRGLTTPFTGDKSSVLTPEAEAYNKEYRRRLTAARANLTPAERSNVDAISAEIEKSIGASSNQQGFHKETARVLAAHSATASQKPTPGTQVKTAKTEPVVNNITVFINGQPAHNVQVQQSLGSHPSTNQDPGF